MSNYEKLSHWGMLLAFLGLCATALAAEYFFSKEAIMDSFKASLPMLNLTIEPAEQFFISRIARRDTWDVHLYFGFAMTAFLIIWMFTTFYFKNKKNIPLKMVLFGSAIVMSVSGIWMWSRLYYPLPEEGFGLLKKVHYYAYWTFIYSLVAHIVMVIYKENKTQTGALSKMINFKTTLSAILLSSLIFSTPGIASTDLEKWTNDQNYIEGVLYLEGSKGYDILTKEISNCPYDKCKLSDIDQTKFGTKKIEIKKPDYKKAIELLLLSSESGNALASDRLLQFLTKQLDYKSKKHNGYLVKEMKSRLDLDVESYRQVIKKTLDYGIKTKKSCYSEYLYGEVRELGLLGFDEDKIKALEHFKEALNVCSSTNLYKMLAQSKVNVLSKSYEN